MTAEQLVRDQLDRATAHVPTSPDVEAAVAGGRRRRRTRRAGLATAAVAAVVAAPLAVSAYLPHETTRAHETPVATAPAPAPAAPVAGPAATDYVPGTDIDETMVATVADHLSLPAPDDVYPSDSVHPGPVGDADVARATDWFATYVLAGQQVDVAMGYADPAILACETGCSSTTTSGWELQEREGEGWHTTSGHGPQQWVFITQAVRDGFYVNVREAIFAPDLEAARSQRTLDQAAVADLVTDPRLSFPRP